MADETTVEKKPKSKTLGHVDVSKLVNLPEWKDFAAKADLAKKANEAHEAAKATMRGVFRSKLKQSADTDIEFSVNGDRVTVIEILEKKQPKKARASDMSELFSDAEETGTEPVKRGFGSPRRG